MFHFAFNRVLTLHSVKSLIKLPPKGSFDQRLTYADCQTLSTEELTATPSEIDTCLVHFKPYAYFRTGATKLRSMKVGAFVAHSIAGCSSKMTSFSIENILSLQETKCGTVQACGKLNNKNASSLEDLREQEVSSTKFKDHKSSPSSSPTLRIEESSYEGNFGNFLFHSHCVCQVCHMSANLFYFCRCVALRNQNHSSF